MELQFSRDELSQGVTIFHNGMLVQVKKVSVERFKQGTSSFKEMVKINERFIQQFPNIDVDDLIKHKHTLFSLHKEYVDMQVILYSLWYRYYFLSLDLIIIGLGGEGRVRMEEYLTEFNSHITNKKFHLSLRTDEGDGNVDYILPNDFSTTSPKLKKNVVVFFPCFDWTLENLKFVGKHKKLFSAINKSCKDCSTFL